MPSDGVEITGLVETQRMITDLAADLVTNAFPPALMAASTVVQGALASAAPRREEEPAKREFPALSESLVTDIEVNVSKRVGIASTGFGDAGPVALWNEFEHRIVTHSGRDTGKVTEPKPFMRRTTDNCADEAIGAFCDSIIKTVKDRYGR